MPDRESCGWERLAARGWGAEPDAEHVAQLIEQLGAPRFIERQLATESLSSMGLAVVGPVKQATQDRDPEIRFRARQILRTVRHLDRQRLINSFIAGVDVDADADLPGWQEFQQIAGTDENARQLYVQMLEDEWEFLDAVYQNDPHVASSLVTRTCGRLGSGVASQAPGYDGQHCRAAVGGCPRGRRTVESSQPDVAVFSLHGIRWRDSLEFIQGGTAVAAGTDDFEWRRGLE